ncbi:hypothetical protein SH601_15860 [Gracilibacillus sp. S3-1-1]|uniref:Uncharacterized protein n=1 Tax=Gracilibacillus pellucidus TaxID=3095368 RepID=A0ACC6M8Y2_9BACI|nr:glycosylhydrolase-like jelly roll fold domain-containing protein [Gracilibacillus sp. S3-1-1]MDX8047443.1 hypothetical protein [Gracilibacillus sp. S3-1-1]
MGDVFQQFINPGSEFSPIPFWFWNDNLDKMKLKEQIASFQEQGVEGFVLHPRMGIPKETSYLSEPFMEYVRFAVEEAANRGMRVILYDEAMYPSGAANGKVVAKNKQYASRALYHTECSRLDEDVQMRLETDDRLVAIYIVEEGEGKINRILPLKITELSYDEQVVKISKEQLAQTNDDTMENCRLIMLVEKYTYGTIRGIHTGQDDGEKDAPRSADLLNPDAVQTFIELTHERYREVIGKFFGNTVFAMFTDEPDIIGRNAKPGGIAWTNHFEQALYQAGLEEEDLLGLFIDIGEKTLMIRQLYEEAVNQQMLEAYYHPIAKWCEENNLYLTGHPAKSDDIGLLKPFTLPGQDVVWRWVAPEDNKGITGEHSTAGKCGADAARHYGRRRNINEYLGVCGVDNTWNLSAADMKWYTDWLAVRGVNLFCPHAFYYSIDGKERSHERPPDVGPHNVWWPYYHYFSTYIKRLSWLMTNSVNQADVAVIALNNQLPWKMAQYFYEHQLEFNYVHEALFVEGNVHILGNSLRVGQQSYQIVVIDELDITQFDERVKEQLSLFIENGGKVYVITTNQPSIKELDAIYLSPTNHNAIAAQFSLHRSIRFSNEQKNIRVSKVKKENTFFYLFTNEGEESCQTNVSIMDECQLEEWNPWTGSRKPVVQNETGEYLLTLPYRESIIWVCQPKGTEIEAEGNIQEVKVEETIPVLQPVDDGSLYWKEEELYDWSEVQSLQYFSGTISYVFTFDYQGKDVEEVTIDLGEVHQIAEVSLNESESKLKMWAPYQVRFTSASLRQGKNTIIIRVTNNSANTMDKQLLPSGLIGPVKICMVQKRKLKVKGG